MQLSKYISDLLYQHDCVTIPGFGSFLGNYKSAEFDLKNERFFPPKKQISFNSQIKGNDGLLAKKIAKELDVDFNEALKEINKVVLSWNSRLKNETILLEDLGELYLSDENKIIYLPNSRSNHLKDSFGLSPLFVRKLLNPINPFRCSNEHVFDSNRITIYCL